MEYSYKELNVMVAYILVMCNIIDHDMFYYRDTKFHVTLSHLRSKVNAIA